MTGRKYIINKWIKYENIKVNDIISYQIGDRKITHRVIKKIDNYLITQGDNKHSNPKPDSWRVYKQNYIGKVIYIF